VLFRSERATLRSSDYRSKVNVRYQTQLATGLWVVATDRQ
jgi:hypothetical protein